MGNTLRPAGHDQLDKLEAAIGQARGLIREAHEAAQEIRGEIKAARQLVPELETRLRATCDAANASVQASAEQIAAQLKTAVEGLLAEWAVRDTIQTEMLAELAGQFRQAAAAVGRPVLEEDLPAAFRPVQKEGRR